MLINSIQKFSESILNLDLILK